MPLLMLYQVQIRYKFDDAQDWSVNTSSLGWRLLVKLFSTARTNVLLR
jgi:hypothetical protein